MLNFILVLPEFSKNFNVFFTIIDKYSKRVALILDKNIWKTKDWAKAIFDRLYIADWDFSK